MIKVDYVSPDGEIIETLELEGSHTLYDISSILEPEKEGYFPAPTIAFVCLQPAVKSRGDWNILLEDTYIQFRQIAQGGGGGGSNPLQMLATLAVAALAIATTVFVPPLLGLTGALGMFVGGVIGMGVMYGGNMLIGALFPQSMSSGQVASYNAESSSPTYNINSTGNQARLYQPEPEGFGRMKIVPDFVAYSWTEYINNEEYGYFVFGIGRGEYEIESMSFGETEFWKNGAPTENSTYLSNELQVEIVEPNNAVTLFPDNVITSIEVTGIQLYGPNQEEYQGAVGPYAVNPPGTYVNKIGLDFEFPAGLGTYNNDGNLDPHNCHWYAEFQSIDDNNNPVGSWQILLDKEVVWNTTTPQRLTYNIPVPPGRYWVRCNRITESIASTGRAMDTLQWSGMKGYLPGSYIYPITVVALYVKASNVLSGTASRNFSVIATRKLPIYNRSTKRWTTNQKTRSWAAAVSHVLRCEWGGQLKDSSIDLDTLWAIDEILQKKGWFYDSYIDGAYLIWTLLNEMCQSQCVIVRFIGPVISFVLDEANRPPTFALTPRNISRDSLSINYSTWDSETPDDVLVQYLDAEYGFQQRDVAASLPESNSLEPTNLNILGITNRKHAFDVAVLYAAHNRWQRISVECQVEALGHIINKGDVCTISHPRFRNTQSGQIIRWNEANASIYVKTDVYNPNVVFGKDSYISFIRPDGSVWGPIKLDKVIEDPVVQGGYTIILNLIDYSDLLLQGYDNPFSWFSDGKCCQNTIWVLYSSKIYQRLMIVDEVKANDLYHYNLKLLNYDHRIYQYNDLSMPSWQGRGQVSTTKELKMPANLKAAINSLTNITITWSTVLYSTYYEIETSIDNITFTNRIRTTVRTYNLNVRAGKTFIRVRGVNSQMNGPWALIAVDTTLNVPASPIVSAGSYLGASCDITWNTVAKATSYGIAVYINKNSVYSTTTTSTKFRLTPEIQGTPSREVLIEITAINSSGSSSPVEIKLKDNMPAKIQSGTFEIGENYLQIKKLSPDIDTDRTGFVIIKGDDVNFAVSSYREYKLFSGFPFTWSNLENGNHYFRIGVRDQFWEVTKQINELNYSDVFTIPITGNFEFATTLEAGI